MRIALTDAFQRHIRALPELERAAACEALLNLSTAFGDARHHAGLGLRKLHGSGVFEIRTGLGLRFVFLVQDQTATLVLAGRHDQVRRWLARR